MSALVTAELLKLRTTRARFGFVLAVVALSGIAAAGTVGTAPEFDLGTPELSREILSSALFASLVAFLIGITSVTSEWRHGTVTRTFLATPRRGRVLVAKELSIVLVAAVLAALAIVVTLAVAVPWLVVESSSLELSGGLAALIVRSSPRRCCGESSASASAQSFRARPLRSSARSSGSCSSRR